MVWLRLAPRNPEIAPEGSAPLIFAKKIFGRVDAEGSLPPDLPGGQKRLRGNMKVGCARGILGRGASRSPTGVSVLGRGLSVRTAGPGGAAVLTGGIGGS
jgi:hypothetical protein